MGPNLKVSITGDSVGLERSMAQARLSATKFAGQIGRSMGAGFTGMIGGFVSAASLGMLARKTAAFADEMEETAQRLGLSTTKLQELSFAAKQNGASLESLTRFIEQLTDAAMDPKKAGAFGKMGINPTGMTPGELFASVSSFARGNSVTATRDALGGIVGARSVGRVINLLQSDLEELGRTAHKAGAVMDEQTLHALATLNDQFGIVSQILMTQFAPALLEVAKVVLRTFGAVKGATGWLGAKTAGLSMGDTMARPHELMLGPWAPFAMAGRMWGKMKRNPNQASFNATADNLFADSILSIEEMIKRLTGYKSPSAPTIPPYSGASPDDKKFRDFTATDLSKVGLFSASQVAFNPMISISQQQLNELRKIQVSTAKTANKQDSHSP